MKKLFSCIAVLIGLLPSTLLAQKPKITLFAFENQASITSMSDNGLWATAKGSNSDNPLLDAYPYLLNLTTGESIFLLTEVNKSVICGANDVTDDGKMVVGNYDGSPAKYENGQWTKLTNAASQNVLGDAVLVSPDGKYIAGICQTGSGENAQEFPYFWVDGKYTELVGLPTINAAGAKAQQNRIVGVSPDGNTLLGCLDFSFPGRGGCCYYIYNRTTHESNLIGEGGLVSIPSHVDMASMSPNGKWVSGTIHRVTEIVGQKNPEEVDIPFQYNVETKKLTIYGGTDDIDTGAYAVDNDGTVFASTPSVNPVRSLRYRVGNFWYDLSLVLKEKYGINFTAATGYEVTGVAMAVSSDCKTISGIAMKGSCYVITFPESMITAAQSVNLLANSTVYPVSGSVISKLATVTVTFDKKAKVAAGAKATLYDGDQVVARSISIKQSSSSDRSFSIGFVQQTLQNGKRYVLKIPAGTFELEGTNMANKDIEVAYIGREDKPVVVQAVSPTSGSAISELSYNSPLTIQYDIPILLKEKAVAYLYKDNGGDEPEKVSDLILTSYENMLGAYPAIVQKLYKGSSYFIYIPAGVATDVNGNSASEEYTIYYDGLYQRPIPQPGATLLEDDFSNTSNSYNNFMLYDGDKNTPTAAMQALQFENLNTPWHLALKESEASNDFCAGSTSMYNPAGQSNDWMSTVQLIIPNDKYFFTFKSQSYKLNKQDVLRVFIWECDNEFNTLNAEIVGRIEKEGKLVYEAVESPGKSEENLEGDWVEHRIPLAEFNGKKIYIAFLNRNNDQSMVFIDDVKVAYEGNFVVENLTEATVIQQQEIEVNGFVKIIGDKNYQSLKLSYYTADNSVSDEITADGLNLIKDDIYEFTFKKKLPLQLGKITDFSLRIVIGDETQEIKSSVKNLAFEPNRKVVIEKSTGAWCANCPKGIVAFDYLQKSFPNNFVPIAVHVAAGGGDPYDYSEYNRYLGLSAQPTGRVDRRETVYSPLAVINSKYSYTSESGNETFTDALLKDVGQYTEADIAITHAIYDPILSKMLINTSVKFAVDVPSANYTVCYVILEDGLVARQQNNSHQTNDPILGEWGLGGSYGPMPEVIYNHVARSVLGNSFSGLTGRIPTSIVANTPYTFSLESAMPGTAIVADMKNASIVCMLINANTGLVVNANTAHFVEGTYTGSENVTADFFHATLSVNGKNVIAKFPEAADAVITLYDVNGMVIDQTAGKVNAGGELTAVANGHKGVILVRTMVNGKVSVQKIFIE